MIVSETFFGVKCNRCKAQYDDGDHSFWGDEQNAIENATESGWHEDKNKHYCDNCHSINEETNEITIFEEFPKEIKKVVEFCGVLGYSVEITDTETSYIIYFRLSYREELEKFEIDFIENQVKDRFVEVNYKPKQYNSQTVVILISKS